MLVDSPLGILQVREAYHVNAVEANLEGNTGTESIIYAWSNNDVVT